jgi:ligand-binding sensor domain-containing protein
MYLPDNLITGSTIKVLFKIYKIFSKWESELFTSLPACYNKIILLLLLAGFFNSCQEDQDVLDPQTLDQWIYYDTLSGLSSNFIWTLFQDKDGNIWTGTEGGGVNKYDGHDWTSYTVFDGLASNSVYAVAQDKDGDMWFGTEGGLNILIGGVMYVIDTLEGEPFIPITLFHDSQQRMWAGTPGYGLVVFTGNNYIPDLLYDKNNEELNIVRAFAEDKTGTIWIATDGGAIFYRNNESDTYDTTSGLYSNEVSYIFQDSWEDIWFATINDELLTRNDGTYSEYIYMYNGYEDAFVYSISEDKKGNIWFASGPAGIIRYNGIEMYTLKLPDRFKGDWFFCSMTDQYGNIWFGTMKNGIVVYISE